MASDGRCFSWGLVDGFGVACCTWVIQKVNFCFDVGQAVFGCGYSWCFAVFVAWWKSSKLIVVFDDVRAVFGCGYSWCFVVFAACVLT